MYRTMSLAGACATLALAVQSAGAAERVLFPKEERSQCTSLVFSHDGKMLAASFGFGSATICLYSIAEGKELPPIRWVSGVHRMAFAPDDKTLVSVRDLGGEAGKLAVQHWSVERSSEQKKVLIAAPGIYDLSQDGKYLATSPRRLDNVYDVWNAATGELEKSTFEEGARFQNVTFFPDGNWIAVKYDAGPLRVLDWRTGKERIKFDGVKGGHSLAFSRDSERLLWVEYETYTPKGSRREDYRTFAAVRNLTTRKLLARVPTGSALGLTPSGGCILIASSSANEIRFHNADHEAGVVLCRLPTGERGAVKLALAPDGRRLAAAMNDGSVVLFDVPPEAAPMKPQEKK